MKVHQQVILWMLSLSSMALGAWLLYPLYAPVKEATFYRGQMVKLSSFGNKAQIVSVLCRPDECFYRIRLSNADVKTVGEFELTAD